MLSNDRKLIAVIGATGQQGGEVVRALQARGQFKVRGLTRNPEQHRYLADEVVEADSQMKPKQRSRYEVETGLKGEAIKWQHVQSS